MALFRSDFKGFVQNVMPEIPEIHPLTGNQIGVRQKALRAEFGVFGPERSIVNPETGQVEIVADISGGFYDSLEHQERAHLTDEEREAIEGELRRVAARLPAFVQEVVAVHVAAPAPWATFDTTGEADICSSAELLNLVPEALRYERENQNRPAVTGALEKVLAKLPDEDKERARPLMEVPPEMLRMPTPHGVSVGAAPRVFPGGIMADTPGFIPKPGVVAIEV